MLPFFLASMMKQPSAKKKREDRVLAEIATKKMEDMSTFEKVLPIVLLSILVVFPIMAFISLLWNRKRLDNKTFK